MSKKTNQQKKGRVGLVLEGGGTRGAYHVGAIRALLEEGIAFDAITGASVGAIHAATYLSGCLDELFEIYKDFDPASVFFGSREIATALDFNKLEEIDLSRIPSALSAFFRDRGFDISPLLRLLQTHIDEEMIRRSPIDFGLVSVNVSDFKVIEVFKEDIPQGKMIEYLLASSALPGFRIPSETRYLDGGVYSNIPIDLLLKKGPFEKVYVVRTRSDSRIHLEREGVHVIPIIPSRSTGTFLQLGNEHVRENMMMGYYDVLRMTRGYQGRVYSIEREEPDSFYRRFVMIDKGRMEMMGKLFGVEEQGYRAFFERTIPLLALILGIKEEGSYQEIATEWMERVAFELDIPWDRVYSETELISQINKELKKMEEDDVRSLGRLDVAIAKIKGLNKTEQTALLRGAWRMAMGGI